MIVQLTTRGLRIDSAGVERIKNEFLKIGKYIPNFPLDTQMNILIEKIAQKAQVGKEHLNFKGWVKVIFPKKVLYAEFKGVTVYESLFKARRTITGEIKKYKELHFKSQSRYPRHETIRQNEEV